MATSTAQLVPRAHVPAKWYQRTTFIAEEGTPNRNSVGFLSLPQVLEGKRKLGTDLFFIVGFANPKIVGSVGQARGDYFFLRKTSVEPTPSAKASRRHIELVVTSSITWKD